MKEFTETIKTVSGAAEKFELYENMLLEWNKKFNLTAITEHGDIEVKHFYDSVTAQKFLSEGVSVLDIGSGAGFPGLVIKIEKPETDVTLVDSVRKKTDYLTYAIDALGLKNIRALHTRIEDLKNKESYDTVTARAVARMNVLAEYCLPFVKTGGVMVAYKSADCDEEMNEAERAIKLLGGETAASELFDLDENTKRRIIVIKKVKSSPDGYPRSGNKPRLKPL